MQVNYYGKWYTSIGGYQCRYWYSFGVGWHRKTDMKRWGYWNIQYDGYFHFFSLGMITFSWLKRPVPDRIYNDHHKP
jgi:hypothetical protein